MFWTRTTWTQSQILNKRWFVLISVTETQRERERETVRMGWIGETMDSIKSLQIRQVSLIRVWNWNSMCFLLSLGDDKLWVCIKNWSFIDFFFFFLVGFFLKLKRTKPNCLLRLMWFCLAHLNWDFQVLFSRNHLGKIILFGYFSFTFSL